VLSAAILAPLALLCVWAGGWPYFVMVLLALAGIGYEWGSMCRWRPTPLLLGLAYAAMAAFSLLLIRSFGARYVYFILLVVWSSDIGAYAFGRLIGGRRLAPSISPGKTWSGAVGGLVTSVVLGGAVAGFSVVSLTWAALLGVASQLGDLGESAVKRRYGVKDSGRLIPGHGGLLDRLDGLMAAAVIAGVPALRLLIAMGGA
jgi:phosphatidate cytidylyltransferase